MVPKSLLREYSTRLAAGRRSEDREGRTRFHLPPVPLSGESDVEYALLAKRRLSRPPVDEGSVSEQAAEVRCESGA